MTTIYLSYNDYDLFWMERVKERVLTAYPNCHFSIENVEFISEKEGYRVHVTIHQSVESLTQKVEELEKRIETLESHIPTDDELVVTDEQVIDLYIDCIKDAIYFHGGNILFPIYQYPASHRILGNSNKVKTLRKYLKSNCPIIDFTTDILPHLNCNARYHSRNIGTTYRKIQTYVTLTPKT